LPVITGNDVTLACAAEHVFGRGRVHRDFAYFFVGAFIGGGIVLGGQVRAGPSGNAGAFGTIPVRDPREPNHQLIQNASIYRLEELLEEHNIQSDVLRVENADWRGFPDILDEWLEETAHHMAIGCVAVCSVLDFEQIFVDGVFPRWVQTRLIQKITEELDSIDTQGIAVPIIFPGELGVNAGAVGAAYQPMLSKYFLEG
jgi:predicted NBD/HSP70 family sugar kinase